MRIAVQMQTRHTITFHLSQTFEFLKLDISDKSGIYAYLYLMAHITLICLCGEKVKFQKQQNGSMDVNMEHTMVLG